MSVAEDPDQPRVNYSLLRPSFLSFLGITAKLRCPRSPSGVGIVEVAMAWLVPMRLVNVHLHGLNRCAKNHNKSNSSGHANDQLCTYVYTSNYIVLNHLHVACLHCVLPGTDALAHGPPCGGTMRVLPTMDIPCLQDWMGAFSRNSHESRSSAHAGSGQTLSLRLRFYCESC